MMWISERPCAAHSSSSSASGRSGALIVLISSWGPSPGANASLKASIRPTGFLRCTVLR